MIQTYTINIYEISDLFILFCYNIENLSSIVINLSSILITIGGLSLPFVIYKII